MGKGLSILSFFTVANWRRAFWCLQLNFYIGKGPFQGSFIITGFIKCINAFDQYEAAEANDQPKKDKMAIAKMTQSEKTESTLKF